MNYRIRNTKKVSYTFMNAANIQDDGNGYFIYVNKVKYSKKTKTELLKRLAEQTDETILSLIKQNQKSCKRQF